MFNNTCLLSAEMESQEHGGHDEFNMILHSTLSLITDIQQSLQKD